jgi:hypothetical protein
MLASKKVLVKIITDHAPVRSVGVVGSKSSIFYIFVGNDVHQILSM